MQNWMNSFILDANLKGGCALHDMASLILDVIKVTIHDMASLILDAELDELFYSYANLDELLTNS
jgi:formate dehydrogenase maturation protein FdhE